VNCTASPANGFAGEYVNDAVSGVVPGETTTVRVACEVAPVLLRTVSVIVYVPEIV
jgi:hypothetical protein